MLGLFYVFIAGVSCVLVAKRGVSHCKCVLILVTVLIVPVNYENLALTIFPVFLHSVVFLPSDRWARGWCRTSVTAGPGLWGVWLSPRWCA